MVNKPSRKEIISKQFGRAPRNISMTEFRALKINFLGETVYVHISQIVELTLTNQRTRTRTNLAEQPKLEVQVVSVRKKM